MTEVAKFFFKQKIDMKRIALQDVEESLFTSWRIVILGPYGPEAAATAKDATAEGIKSDINSSTIVSADTSNPPTGCPFHK